MAECRITSMADSVGAVGGVGDDHQAVNGLAAEGRVGRVCKEWLVREDGVLAYQLQNQEISQHYEGNRNKSRTVREDLPIAKGLQRNEEEEATAVRLSYERLLDHQYDEDERLAREMQRRLMEQESSQRRTEEEDERLAKQLAARDKARLVRKRLEREKQQVEQLSAQLNVTHVVNPPHHHQHSRMSQSDGTDSDNQQFSAATASASHSGVVSADRMNWRNSANSGGGALSEDELDLSEFCMQPPDDLTPDELRIFLEEQDAEIARLLQQQEIKRKSTVDKGKLAQIEAQDYEIARRLHKQEKERLRRLKERAKHKALQKRQEESGVYSRGDGGSGSDSNSTHRQLYGLPVAAAPARRQQLNSHNSDTDSITYEEINQPATAYHTNIAAFLDPTYKPNSTVLSNPLLNNNSLNRHDIPSATNGDMESSVDDFIEQTGLHFAQVYKVSPMPSPNDSPQSTTDQRRQQLNHHQQQQQQQHHHNYHLNDYDPDDDPSIPDNYYPIDEPKSRRNRTQMASSTMSSSTSATSPVLPYMPVQGQRRISSMEKKKKPKDGCKTQ
ncbi:uncharacterized protein LOC128962891 [Oppia nitens]|uniref:uncharacterized protein LOC128962891 n=1 Tax=Oppia nitens TaxID=1686743 RepID=UPI0023DA9BE6|nr:uncharacterized protein LOC128962891 [Oppia nitens]